MKLTKKVAIPVVFVFVLSCAMQVCAGTVPSAFWADNTKYVASLDAKNYSGIVEYGNRSINTVLSAGGGNENKNMVVSRYSEIGEAYAAMGKYAESCDTYRKLCSFARQYGNEFYDHIKNAEARIAQYTEKIQLYVDGGAPVYFGAKNEKKNGVLFGVCANGATRNRLDNESMVLIYQELGETLLASNTNVVKKASQSGLAVEFALNCPGQGKNIENIRSYTNYLKEISDMLAKYPDVPVYLRFAAEFDIWDNLTDADSYKTAFRYVSDYFKNRNSNVAMVWSPNHESNWYIDIDDYYPGDSYVDWVGVSLYAQKYFRGDKNQPEEREIAFNTGVNSDPVIAISDIIETYGNRKPIMISESGVGHKVMTTGEDATDFALRRLEEYYGYLPIVYPQIKLMAYFDWHVNADSEKNDFRLSSNTALQNRYLQLTKGERFIQGGYSGNTGVCYRPLTKGSKVHPVFSVACYAHRYKNDAKKVTYFIDGKYAGLATSAPFATYIDASEYAGKHVLSASVLFEDGTTAKTEYEVNILSAGKEITVTVSGNKVSFDQTPVLYNDRTMVPVRKVFEALGANVDWNNSLQTAVGKKGDRTVTVTVGEKKIDVNGRQFDIDAAPIVVSDRTLVPARAIAEGLGCNVEWDGGEKVVSITPKPAKWSQWDDYLPDYVTPDLYYIEEQDEYRSRTCKKEYFRSDRQLYYADYVRTETSYGNWSGWQNGYIQASDDVEVETRTQYEPQRYHYAHYCTGGYINDTQNRYRTKDYYWHDECDYHDLGWFDSPLPYSEDSTYNHAYYVNGEKYRCDNTCFRWYLIETTGGEYTQYRSRNVCREYIYSEWGDWSDWSWWSDEDPYEWYDYYDDETDIEVQQRTVYRFKEK